MSRRQIIIGCLMFATLVIPIVELSFGFHYITSDSATEGPCPIQRDIMILMAIGGVFQVIFFAVAFGFLTKATPAKYKKQANQSAAQKTAKGNNRASLIIIGFITGILGACAIIFFVLLQIQVYTIFNSYQSTNSTGSSYCEFVIFSSAFGMSIATYVAFILLLIIGVILLCGICVQKK